MLKKIIISLIVLVFSFGFVSAGGPSKCEQKFFPSTGMNTGYWINAYDEDLRKIDSGKTYNKLIKILDTFFVKIDKNYSKVKGIEILEKISNKLKKIEKKLLINNTITNKKNFYLIKVLESRIKYKIIKIKIKKCENDQKNDFFVDFLEVYESGKKLIAGNDDEEVILTMHVNSKEGMIIKELYFEDIHSDKDFSGIFSEIKLYYINSGKKYYKGHYIRENGKNYIKFSNSMKFNSGYNKIYIKVKVKKYSDKINNNKFLYKFNNKKSNIESLITNKKYPIEKVLLSGQFVNGVRLPLPSEIINKTYFIYKGELFLNGRKLYEGQFYGGKLKGSAFFKECQNRKIENGRYKFPNEILGENKNYLIYNISSGICEGGGGNYTYILNKNTNISKKIILKNEKNEFKSIDNSKIILKKYSRGDLLGGIVIENKGYFNNMEIKFPKNGINYIGDMTIKFSEIEKYLEQEEGIIEDDFIEL